MRAQLSDKDVALLRTLSATEQGEFSPTPFAKQFQHEYFGLSTDRGLLLITYRMASGLVRNMSASQAKRHISDVASGTRILVLVGLG